MSLVDDKFKQLSSMNKENMWYIVKQLGNFWMVCYGASIIEDYQKTDKLKSIDDFYKDSIKQLDLDITGNYRVLRYVYYFGLASTNGGGYADASLTEVYYKIKELCNGKFEDINKYYEIIEQQIEKLYISWDVDGKYQDERKKYNIYPLFLVYKVLIGLGELTGKYYLTSIELKLILGSTYTYDEYLKVIFIIMEIRSNEQFQEKLKKFNALGEDIRYITIMQNLKVFEFKKNNNIVYLKKEYIEYVQEKIKKYEHSNLPLFNEYKRILCSNVSLFDTHKGDVKMDEHIKNEEIKNIPSNKIDKSISKNLIIYGAPGTGKSNRLEKMYRKRYFNNEYLYSRVTFNSNYTYSDFVGVYKPTTIYVKNDNNGNEYYSANKIDKLQCQMMPVIDYSFVPGPFIDILCKALNDAEHNYLLIIEEINRADVASVFGDVFQMLDRGKEENNYGESEYGIVFNKDIMDYIASRVKIENKCFIKDKLVKIPSNMYIFATMNSADQNVNKMDTAFKRRWEFDYIGLNDNEIGVNDVYIEFKFIDNAIKWNTFRHKLNKYLSKELSIEEDKLIGPYFVNKFSIKNLDGKDEKFISQDDIKYKLFSYLKDDVLRHRISDLFKENYTFGELIETYENRNDIFVDEFKNLLLYEESTTAMNLDRE